MPTRDEITIRDAITADSKGIARVHIESWRSTYKGIVPDDVLDNLSYESREKKWHEILSAPENSIFFLVATKKNGEVIGFASGGNERNGDERFKGEIYAIYILPKYQRRNIGQQLTIRIAERLNGRKINSMLVWVLAENPSKGFYEALGAEKIDEKLITIGKIELLGYAYGWKNTRKLIGMNANNK